MKTIYTRNRKHYTLNVIEIEGRYHAQLTDNTNGNTWTGAPFAHRDSALRNVQNKFNEIDR